MNFIEVLKLADLPPQSQKIVSLGATKIALFHYDNEITAMANACLHKGGPLAMGRVEKKYDGSYVTCPGHGWEYNIKSGSAPPGYHDQQAFYEVKVEDEKILISEKPVTKAKQDEQGCDDGVCLNDKSRACDVEPSVVTTTSQELKRVEHERAGDDQDCADEHLPNA